MAEQDATLRDIIGRLVACQHDLSAPRDNETAQLIEIAVLQLRMRLHRVSEAELQSLSDDLAAHAPASDRTKACGSP